MANDEPVGWVMLNSQKTIQPAIMDKKAVGEYRDQSDYSSEDEEDETMTIRGKNFVELKVPSKKIKSLQIINQSRPMHVVTQGTPRPSGIVCGRATKMDPSGIFENDKKTVEAYVGQFRMNRQYYAGRMLVETPDAKLIPLHKVHHHKRELAKMNDDLRTLTQSISELKLKPVPKPTVRRPKNLTRNQNKNWRRKQLRVKRKAALNPLSPQLHSLVVKQNLLAAKANSLKQTLKLYLDADANPDMTHSYSEPARFRNTHIGRGACKPVRRLKPTDRKVTAKPARPP